MGEQSEGRDLREGYVFDSEVKGADTTYWSVITGTLATSGGKLRFNADRAVSFIQHIFGKYTFAVNVPTRPAANDNRVWGLRNPQAATIGAVYFHTDSQNFNAISYDNFGNVETTVLTFDSDNHDGNEIRYGISWERDLIQFLIGDTVVATHATRIGTVPLSIEIRNAAADNMDVGYLEIRHAKNII